MKLAALRLLGGWRGPAVFGLAALMGWSAVDPERWALMLPAALSIAIITVSAYPRGTLSRGNVVFWGLAARVALVWLLPVLSDDAYRYIWDGLLQHSGINPYRYVPSDPDLSRFHSEEIYEGLNSPEYHSVYPPFSQITFAVGAIFYGSGWQVSYFTLKGLFVACEMVGLLLLSRMTTGTQLAAYAWNPLVLLTVAGQLHTDTVLVLLLLGTVWLARRRRAIPASIALSLAGLVKIYPFLLLPFLWRRFGLRSVWPAVLTIVLLSAPYFSLDALPNVWTSLELYYRLFEFNAGIYYALKLGFSLLIGLDAGKVIGPALGLLFLGGVLACYRYDMEGRLSLRRAFVVVLGLQIALATTVHPWYLLPLLALTAPAARFSWHWYWLSVWSIGTYLLYAGGPYAPFVAAGWAGWLTFLLWRHRTPLADVALRWRARGKVRRLLRELPKHTRLRSVLDLGAAEGCVGRDLMRRHHCNVVLADVSDQNRTSLEYLVYDGKKLPLPPGEFDLTLLYFVLHHSTDPGAVVREAVRVSKGLIFVAESIYDSPLQRRLLEKLDRLANRLRGNPPDTGTPEFRTGTEWRAFFEAHGIEVVSETRRGRVLHPQVYFVLRTRGPYSEATSPKAISEASMVSGGASAATQ